MLRGALSSKILIQTLGHLQIMFGYFGPCQESQELFGKTRSGSIWPTAWTWTWMKLDETTMFHLFPNCSNFWGSRASAGAGRGGQHGRHRYWIGSASSILAQLAQNEGITRDELRTLTNFSGLSRRQNWLSLADCVWERLRLGECF